ncbi:MAG: hypothetical protein OEZ13_03365 [Spirochaetia bacterium]|nr:hypothetical protein [Spirochaetia bacterium]
MSYKEPFNWKRKLFHLSGLIIPIIYFFNLPDIFDLRWFKDDNRSLIFYVLLILTALMLVIEYLRFKYQYWQKIFLKLLSPLLKGREEKEMQSSIHFFISCAFIIGFLPKETAVLSVLFLSMGDPAAAYFGGRYGTVRFKNGKSLQGLLAGVGVSFLVGILFLLTLTVNESNINNYFNDFEFRLFLYSKAGFNIKAFFICFLGAVSAFIIELFSGKGFLDDNLTIPAGSGLVMTFLTVYFYDIAFSEVFYSLSDLLFLR